MVMFIIKYRKRWYEIQIETLGVTRMTICSIPDCESAVLARTWCVKHYKRWYKTGDPLLAKSAPNGNRKKHPLYGTYCDMLNRCNNSNNRGYEHYGGRGITICDRWQGVEGFDNFIADMGDKPTPEHSINRIDNDGNYEPSNCRWATRSEQIFNRGILAANKSGVTGVCQKGSKWAAYITYMGQRKSLTLDTKEEAIGARKRLEMEYVK